MNARWIPPTFPVLSSSTTQDLSLIPVTTLEEVLEIISLGLKVRATHETKMNQVIMTRHETQQR